MAEHAGERIKFRRGLILAKHLGKIRYCQTDQYGEHDERDHQFDQRETALRHSLPS
ncbi:hypothetical protein D9M69_686800 [compost metagenome]